MNLRSDQWSGWAGLLACAVTAISLALPAPVGAQPAASWPNKPVRLVVAFAPGGFVDQTARVLAAKLGEVWGQQVIVDNRAGAAGNIGTEMVARAQPDGYTLLAAFDSNIVINPTLYAGRLSFDPGKDLVPITKVTQVANAIAAHPGFAPRTCKEFIQEAKTRAQPLNYASPGVGTTGHLAAELVSQIAGAPLTAIPYKGGGQAVLDVMAGQVPIIFTSLPTVRQQAAQGKLRLLAVTSASRVRELDEVPTLQECGLAGIDVFSWVGVMAPAGASPALVSRIEADVRRAMSGGDAVELVRKMGADLVLNSPTEFAEQIRIETRRWASVIQTNKIKPE